jgi:hypothetical protein
VKAETRLPIGWKRTPDPTCGDCLDRQYVRRAVTLAITRPLDATWPEFGAALRDAWAETTRCANWIATELYARDVRRGPTDGKLGPMPKVYLYPEIRALFPALAPINVTSLIRQVEQTYRAQRYELIWTRARSLATYRYPVPAPLHDQGLALEPTTADGITVVRVRLGDRWWRLRVYVGHGQRARARHLQTSSWAIGAGALLRVTRRPGDHRSGDRDVKPMLKLVGWFPRETAASVTPGCRLVVETGASDLLVLRVAGRGIVGTISGDQVRRAIRGYTVRRERLAADLGVSRRFRASEAAGMRVKLARMADRSRDQLRTWLAQIAADVVRLAQRERVEAVTYDDSTDTFCAPFPWQALRMRLQTTCENHGLAWVYASGQIPPDPPGSLAVEGSREVSA